MEEELLQIIEQMEAAGESPQEIAKVVQAYNTQPEKKNQVETESVDGSGDGLQDGSEQSIAADMWDNLKANTKDALAGISGIPQALTKGIFSLIAPQELEDMVNEFEPEQREDFINNILNFAGSANPAAGFSLLSELGGSKQEELLKESEELRSKMTQYSQSITEDIGQGEFAQAGRRLAVEGVGALPSVIQAMIPYVGLASVTGGTAANKMERLEAGGEDISLSTTANAALTGMVEGLLEKYTANQGKALVKSLIGQGDKVVRKGIGGFIDGLKELGKGGLGEGGTEALQAAGENLIDAITTGNEKEAGDILTEIADSFLVGFVVGAPMKGGQVGANAINQAVQRKRLPEGTPQELQIPAVEEPAEGGAVGDPKTTPEQIPDTEGVVTPENRADETEQAQVPDTAATEPTAEPQKTKLEEIGEKSRKQGKKDAAPIGQKLQNTFNKAIDQIVDRQGTAKRIIRKAGLPNTVDFMVANSGASSHAKNLSEKAYQGTVNNLTNKEIAALEEIIFARRVQAIDQNRAERGLDPVRHPDGYNSEQAAADLETYRNRLGEDVYQDLLQRSENYFTEYKNLLQTMRTEGLITQETYDIFAEVNYQPRQFLDFLEDMNGNFLVEELGKAETVPLSQQQIKAMKGGSESSLNMDAFGILESSILTRSRAVFGNRMNNTFATEFANRLPEIEALRSKENLTKDEQQQVENFELLEENVRPDRIIGFKKNGQPKYALEKANTKGWSPIYYYRDGIKNRMWLKNDFHQQYTDTNNQYLGATARENISLFSGTSTVKTLATGNNPLFFITNTPRDFAFILSFSPEYGNEVISNSLKLFRDAARGVRDVVKGTENYDKALEYGLGMDFLALQGKYKEKGLLKKSVDAVMNQKTQDKITKNAVKRFLDKFNLASEVGLRMAVFNKSVENQLANLDVADINSLPKEQRDVIYTKAVKQARQLTDFNQGGKAVKALDAGIPYLNAAVQGTRAAASSIKQRPLEAAIRIAQIAGYTTGAFMTASLGAIAYFRDDSDEEAKEMTNSQIYFETLRGVSEYDLNNYFIVPLGTRNENGDWNYLRIAKAQSLTPFLNMSEHFARKVLAEQNGVEYKQDLGETMVRTIETNILPLEPSPKQAAARIPFVDAAMALYGIDSYTGNPLSWERGKIPEQLEGIVDKRVEPAFKTFGEAIGQSPVRLQNAVESYVTTPSTNPYVGIGYAMGNLFAGDRAFKDIADDFGKDILKAASRRLFKNTSEFNKVAKAKERVSDDIIEAYRKHITTEATVRNAVKEAKRSGEAETAIQGLEQAFQDSPDLKEKSLKWFKSEFKKKRLNPLVSSLRFEDNKEVKALLIADRFGDKLMKDSPDYTEQERAILKQLLEEKVIDSDVIRIYTDIFKSE